MRQRLNEWARQLPARLQIGAEDAWQHGKVGLVLAGLFIAAVVVLVVFG